MGIPTILIVEDDQSIIDTLRMFLGFEGYDVRHASSVSQAISIVGQHDLDVVLLDYMLQEGTAEPVVEAIRAKQGCLLPIVLFTAAENPQGIAKRLNVEAVVAKPFELDTLLCAIQRQLDNAVRGRQGVESRTLASVPAGL